MAKRQSNGDGTRAKQTADGRWRIDMTISDDGENKSRKSLYGKSEGEVIAKRDALKEELKNGCLVSSQADKMTLGPWLDEWLEVYKKGKKANNTYSAYSDSIRLRITDDLKKIPLKKIRHNTLQKFINELGEKYSSATCSIARAVLHQSLKVAVKNKYILTSPADGLIVPKIVDKEAVPLCDADVNLLLADRKNTRNYLYYVLSIYTGARIGEVLGLSWNDIDLKNNIIHIRHSLKYNRLTKKYELGLTKTEKSRDVPILPKLISTIKLHKVKQSEEKLSVGKDYNVNNMVFCDSSGEYVKMSSMQAELTRAADALKIGIGTTPHTLRHTFVSQMISAGNASITLISKIIGHANIGITLKTYSHLMPGDVQEAFKSLEKHMENIVI